MPKILKDQRGFAPVILVIILIISIVGVAVVKKDLWIKSDRTTEVSDSNTPDQSPGTNSASEDDAKGGLADKPFEYKIAKEKGTIVGPQFSITPPAGWTIKPPSGDNRVTLEAPSRDERENGLANFYVWSNIVVHIEMARGKSVDEVLPESKNNFATSGIEDVTTQKTKFSNEEAYYFEGFIKAGKLGAKDYEAQLRSEIAKAGKKVPEADIQKGVQFVMDNFTVKLVGYIIYKDGYTVTVSGKALESAWEKREPQIKASMDTFKFLPK